MNGTWINPESLHPALTYLSVLAKYDLTPDDIQAIDFGIVPTNDEADVWFEYPLHGESTIRLAFACDAESDVLHVRWTAPPQLRREVETTMNLANCFILIDRNERAV